MPSEAQKNKTKRKKAAKKEKQAKEALQADAAKQHAAGGNHAEHGSDEKNQRQPGVDALTEQPKPQDQHELEKERDALKLQLQVLEQQLHYHREEPEPQQQDHLAADQLKGLKNFLDGSREINVPNFDSSSTMPLQDWLALVDMLGHNTSDDVRIRTVMKKIKDTDVLQRLLAARQVPTSWSVCKQLLLGDQEDLLDAIANEWESINQDGSSVEQYFLRFQGVLRRYQRAEPSFQPVEQQQMSKFRKGLKPFLRSAVAATACVSVSDVVKAAKRVEADVIQNQRGAMLNSIQATVQPAQREFLFRPKPDQLEMQEEANRMQMDVLTVFQTFSAAGGKCYACGNTGHWKNDPNCPKNVRKAAKEPSRGRSRSRSPARHGRPTSYRSKERTCPRHPQANHTAAQCTQICRRHPDVTHTSRNCSSSSKKGTCFKFNSAEGCSFGRRCKFEHVGEGHRAASARASDNEAKHASGPYHHPSRPRQPTPDFG